MTIENVDYLLVALAIVYFPAQVLQPHAFPQAQPEAQLHVPEAQLHVLPLAALTGVWVVY